MDLPQNISVLSLNNNFYKVLKTIKDKNQKNESVAAEVEWIQSQLLSENSKICENAVNVLISSCGAGIDFGLVLNTLLSTLPRVQQGSFEIVADGLIRILLLDLEKPNYVCPFGILTKAHPLVLLFDGSSEKMLFLSTKIVGILKNRNR